MSGFAHASGPGRAVDALGAADLPLNVMSIDVEDYFQVSAFEGRVERSEWGSFESRVCANTQRVLELFASTGVRATFFTLGWVADRFPGLVRAIVEQGHELASHGYAHRLTYELSPAAFREDLRRARISLEDAAGVQVVGYRAPSYSIVKRSLWALDVLVDEGYAYDASIYPIRHDRYGMPDWHRHIHRLELAGGSLWELPGSTVRLFGVNLPIGGGGYFRLLPYAWTSRGIRRVNQVEKEPAVFYLHPWEIDPDQPRLPAGPATRFRHYRNLDKTLGRLERLVSEFRFGTVREVLNARGASLRESRSVAIAGVRDVAGARYGAFCP